MLSDLEKLAIIKEIEEKGSHLKSPGLNEAQREKLTKFDQYKEAYKLMKIQDPNFKIEKLEIKPTLKSKQFKLEEWVLNHYNIKPIQSNNDQGDIKI